MLNEKKACVMIRFFLFFDIICLKTQNIVDALILVHSEMNESCLSIARSYTRLQQVLDNYSATFLLQVTKSSNNQLHSPQLAESLTQEGMGVARI